VVGQPQTSEGRNKKAEDPPSDWWLIIPTIAIAGAAGVQLWIYHRQANYMRRGLRISIRQARISNKSLRETKNAIKIAVASANAAIDNATTAEKTLEEIKAQGKLTAKSVDAVILGANAAQQSANAAKDSALAVVNGQRAWVVVQPAHLAPKLVPAIPGMVGAIEHMFCYRIWNAGKATATDVKAFGWYVIVDSLDELPVLPEYGVFQQFPNGVLIPTDKPHTELTLWSCEKLRPNPILWQSDIDDIENRKKFLFAYGKVTYKNGVGADSFTAFGFVYHAAMDGDWKPKGFLHAGPPEYNKAT
jgi:hypothetical protein